MKHCPKCGETKPRDQFQRNARAKDGLFRMCKPCSSAYYAVQYRASRERVNNALIRGGYRPADARPWTVRRRWTQAEKDYAFAHYGPMKAPAIAAALGKTAEAVRQMVRSGNRRCSL